MFTALQLVFLFLFQEVAFSMPRDCPEFLRVQPILKDSEKEEQKLQKGDIVPEGIAPASQQLENIDLSGKGLDAEPQSTRRPELKVDDSSLRNSEKKRDSKAFPKLSINIQRNSNERNEGQENCHHKGLEFLDDFFKLPQYVYNFYAG